MRIERKNTAKRFWEIKEGEVVIWCATYYIKVDKCRTKDGLYANAVDASDGDLEFIGNDEEVEPVDARLVIG